MNKHEVRRKYRCSDDNANYYSPYHKSIHRKSLRFAIFRKFFGNCELKRLLPRKKNSKIPQIVTFFWKYYRNDLMVYTA